MNLKDLIEIFQDYIDDEGYVLRYDYDGKRYYNTGICLRGPSGRPGRPGRDGDIPYIDPTTGNWFVGGVNTNVKAATENLIDEKLNDILGIDAEGINELKQLIKDNSSETGILSQIKNKQDKITSSSKLDYSLLTNTPSFKGTYNYVNDLSSDLTNLSTAITTAGHTTPNDNDYCFVSTLDNAGNTLYNRYKYTVVNNTGSWGFEYSLNNPSFTSDLWAAINSGATSLNIGYISIKEDKFTIVQVENGSTTLSAEVGKYYTASNVGTLAITLPDLTGSYVQSVVFFIETGSTPQVTFTATDSIYYSDSFAIEASSSYEVNALWNGSAWVIAMVKMEAGV